MRNATLWLLADAINQGAASALAHLVSQSRSFEVRRLSCEALASLAEVLQGREAIAEAHGMESLTGALVTTPEAAAGAFKVCGMLITTVSAVLDGSAYAHPSAC